MLPILMMAAITMGVFSLLKLGPAPNGTGRDYPFREAPPLLSASEIVFNRALSEAVNGDYHIGFKVRLQEVIQPKRGIERSRWNAANRRVGDSSVAFVLLNPEDFSIVAAIDLEATSQRSDADLDREHFLKQAFRAVNVPYIRIKCAKHYSVSVLRQMIDEEIQSQQPVA